MKKTLKLLLCITMVCALSACFLTACAAKATAIEVVSPKTEYFVGEAIDYDNLPVQITYDDGTQRQGTLKQLNLSVKSKADLSKAGKTSYTIGFGALSHTVSLTVTENDGPAVTATAIEVVSPKTEYFVGEAIDYDNLSVQITYDDGTRRQGTLKQLNLSVESRADLSKAGETSYTIGFGTLSHTVTLTVTESDGPTVTATAIEVVSPKTEYFVGDTINYDALMVKVTYSDDTSKEDTLKKLGAAVTQRADLSKAGKTSFIVTLGELQDEVTVTVNELLPYVMAVYAPSFYTNYQTASADRATSATETRADFRKTGEIYEVGNVNKFIFRPSVKAEDAQGETVTINNVKTTVKVYGKNTGGKFVLIPDTDLEGIVAIDDNTYKFTDEAAGKTFKLEITLDASEYDLDGLDDESDATLAIEFVVVGGGYNVYDQLGLSVMNDLSSKHWTEIWKCDIDSNYNLTARTDSLKLEADDKPLCEYVGKIDWVVLHSSFALDADQMPSYYFWSEESDGFATAKLALTAHKEAQNLLVGSLRDGIGNNIHFTVTNVDSDTNRYSSQLGFGLNMQKAFFSTYNVSVSGNYNNITVPKTDSKGGRRLYSYLDYELKDQRDNPVPHWQVFQMYQSKVEGKAKEFTLKNMAFTGNGGLVTETSFAPASLNLLNCYSTGLDITNVVANAFYTNVACDGYSNDNAINVDSIKFYDAFSNMFYLWRANVKVVNSELIGSGGPLFILCDGSNFSAESGGAFLTVDKKSVLEAYATGSESWYKLYNAQGLVQQITGNMEVAFNNIGKTVRFHKDQNGKYTAHTKSATGTEYVNVIAAMICEPGDLMMGDNSNKLIVRGTFTTVDEDENVVEKFDTRNIYVTSLSAFVGNDGTKFAPIFQTGSLFTYTDGTALYTLGATGGQAFDPASDGVSWFTDTHDKLGIYMSAGSMSTSANAPYFGVVVGSANYVK